MLVSGMVQGGKKKKKLGSKFSMVVVWAKGFLPFALILTRAGGIRFLEKNFSHLTMLGKGSWKKRGKTSSDPFCS